ncbi:hypothetical protein, partial [Bradyrhizobium sp.]|uniref:hypothetical protein n=1 Tax=Bradyrhizobium sp. TaxID=376 RepID=UPI00391A549E
IVLIGSALGIVGGLGFGQAMITSYHGFFRLPELPFRLAPGAILAGVAISTAQAGTAAPAGERSRGSS